MRALTLAKELKEQFADWFFSRELDETHDRALRYGMEQATRILSFQMETQKEKIKMTPTELKGYEKAQAVFAETRAGIRGNFGANV